MSIMDVAFTGSGMYEQIVKAEFENNRCTHVEAQAEVVRCRECKYYSDNVPDNNLRNGFCTRLPNQYMDYEKPDDYCSHGEFIEPQVTQSLEK